MPAISAPGLRTTTCLVRKGMRRSGLRSQRESRGRPQRNRPLTVPEDAVGRAAERPALIEYGAPPTLPIHPNLVRSQLSAASPVIQSPTFVGLSNPSPPGFLAAWHRGSSGLRAHDPRKCEVPADRGLGPRERNSGSRTGPSGHCGATDTNATVRPTRPSRHTCGTVVDVERH